MVHKAHAHFNAITESMCKRMYTYVCSTQAQNINRHYRSFPYYNGHKSWICKLWAKVRVRQTHGTFTYRRSSLIRQILRVSFAWSSCFIFNALLILNPPSPSLDFSLLLLFVNVAAVCVSCRPVSDVVGGEYFIYLIVILLLYLYISCGFLL